MFDLKSIMLREVCNGIMFVSAVILIFIFARYIFKRAHHSDQWPQDIAVRGAASLIVLMVGHALRAFSGWMQFVWLDLGWDPDYWANGVELFAVATTLIIAGKYLIMLTFSPRHNAWMITLAACALSVAIPVAVLLLAWYGQGQ